MPAKYFWMFAQQVPRIRAMLALEGVTVARVAVSRKGGQAIRKWQATIRGNGDGTSGLTTLAKLKAVTEAANVTHR